MPAKRAKSKTKPKSNARSKLKTKAQAASKSSVGATKDKDKAKEQIELGYKTAVSLIAEIILPDGVTPPKKPVLLPDIEDYPGFIKITKSGRTHYPSKEALTKIMGADINSAVAFCYITLQTDVSKAFDVDHVCPRDYFVKKQKLLLDYLNKNHDFAKGFLGEHITGKATHSAKNHKEKIGLYFMRDKTTGEIKATKWFCDSCYNSTSNLTYLLHYINREKRESPPSLWLQGAGIHEDFKADLLAQGGISEGVIMQGVIIGTKDRMPQLVLKGARSAENMTIYLHEGEYQGLGDYIRSWFLINKAKTIRASSGISDIKDQLYDVLKDEFHGRMDKKGGKLENTLIMINGVFSANRKFLSILGSSSSDSSVTKKGRGTNWQIAAVKALMYMSMLKRLKKMMSSWIAPSYKETFEQEFYNIFLEKGFPELPRVSLDEACRIVEETFGGAGKENREQLSEADFIKFVDNLMEQVDPVKQSLRERSLREAAEKENAQLKALLASAGIVVPGGAQAASVDQMAVPVSSAIVQRPIRRAAKLAGLSQQQITATIPSGELQKRGRRGDSTGGSAEAATVAMAPAKKRQPPATRM